MRGLNTQHLDGLTHLTGSESDRYDVSKLPRLKHDASKHVETLEICRFACFDAFSLISQIAVTLLKRKRFQNKSSALCAKDKSQRM